MEETKVRDIIQISLVSTNPTKDYAIKEIIAESIAHPCYAVIPGCVTWTTPEAEHISPFCADMECFCHFDNERMETFFILPIEQGEMDIAEAIDRYHCEPGYMARKRDEALELEAVLR